MDALLKLAADAGHEVSLAEEAVVARAHDTARDALDRAADLLQELRDRWPSMSGSERAVVGPAAQAARGRLDECVAMLPARVSLSEGDPVIDPEQERDPG